MAPDSHASDLPRPINADEFSSVTRTLRRAEDHSIDEDVYCLGCGYNLRGLIGDPVTCPECGKSNATGELIIPAETITDALRSMETAPTTCVAMVLIFLCSLFVLIMCAVNNSSIAIPAFFLVGSMLLAVFAIMEMRRSFNARPGWRRILFEFHLVTALVIVSCGLVIAALVTQVLITALIVWVLGVCGIVIGSLIYRASRRRLAAIQREAAVRMAEDILRRQLRRTD